jgi:hypothetical protein
MYLGGITYFINKSFGRLQLVPDAQGLRLYYLPVKDGVETPGGPGTLDILVPLDAVGGLWATTRAFLYEFESLDENIILQGSDESGTPDTLIKLYRDKPGGKGGKLAGTESAWLRIVTGRSEEERRRIKLGNRDLICLELACTAVLALAGVGGGHRPTLHKV